MIQYIIVTNHLGQSLTLDMKDPEESGFFIQSIEGLNPPKANINTSDDATSDGSRYTSAKVNARNIVLRLGIYDLSDAEARRLLLYKYFPIKKSIQIIVVTDYRVVRISGYVESNEFNIFTKTPETAISIICPNPFFYALTQQTTMFSGTVSMFSFPFSNESLVTPLLQFGNIISNTEQSIIYEGDAPVGVTILIHATGNVGDITIFNTYTGGSFFIDAVKLFTLTGIGGLKNGDDVLISSSKNNKSIYLIRSGVTINILSCINKEADWLQLQPGDNVLAYDASIGTELLHFTIQNDILYEGV